MARFLLNLFRKVKNEKVLDKGRDCYDNGQLLDYQIEESGNKNDIIFEMKGRVNGTGEVYTPEIKFTRNEIIDFHCDCVYFDLNKSICKHIVALAFEGNNFIEELEETEETEIIEYFKKKEVEKNRIFLD